MKIFKVLATLNKNMSTNNRTQSNYNSMDNVYFNEKAYLRAMIKWEEFNNKYGDGRRSPPRGVYKKRPKPGDFFEYRPSVGGLRPRSSQ